MASDFETSAKAVALFKRMQTKLEQEKGAGFKEAKVHTMRDEHALQPARYVRGFRVLAAIEHNRDPYATDDGLVVNTEPECLYADTEAKTATSFNFEDLHEAAAVGRHAAYVNVAIPVRVSPISSHSTVQS
ncbi:hypothetical protein JCM11641_006341 [Rhodosporidiobolus odoratus]